LSVWSTSSQEEPRIVAFLNIRKLCITAAHPFCEIAMKGSYMSFIRVARTTTPFTLSALSFMRNCVAEIYTLDPAGAYRQAFSYIRQLAIQLRNAITLRTKESYRAVYNWQFIHGLRVWVSVLANSLTMSDEKNNDMKLLIYPLTQVINGTARYVQFFFIFFFS
jgi:nucleolar complex protein 2